MAEIRMRDGALLRYDDVGEGRPVLFVHGWAMTGGLFRQLTDMLGRGLRAIAPDLRFHGGSSRAGAPDIALLGRDLVDFAAALDLEDAVVVGWSMGAMAAWSAMSDRRFADRVGGLVAVDMSPRIVNDDDWLLGLADRRDLAATLAAAQSMREDWAGAVGRFVPRIVAEGAEAARASIVADLRTAALSNDGGQMAALWESMAVQDFRGAIRSGGTPTLAVYGEKSRLYAPGSSRYIARESVDGRAVGFAESGHAPHLEEPRRFVEVLRAFAASTAKDQAAPARAGAAR